MFYESVHSMQKKVVFESLYGISEINLQKIFDLNKLFDLLLIRGL